mmetsp:Transcript_55371/g.179579  ORF Transcript_55371/g.179579 Transcript_55371/m.179579 type:complete len:208 (-) Transcript_55371:131-754(-)
MTAFQVRTPGTVPFKHISRMMPRAKSPSGQNSSVLLILYSAALSANSNSMSVPGASLSPSSPGWTSNRLNASSCSAVSRCCGCPPSSAYTSASPATSRAARAAAFASPLHMAAWICSMRLRPSSAASSASWICSMRLRPSSAASSASCELDCRAMPEPLNLVLWQSGRSPSNTKGNGQRRSSNPLRLGVGPPTIDERNDQAPEGHKM